MLPWINCINILLCFYSIRKKAEHESEIQSLLKLKSKNNVYLKQLYMEAYHISAVYHLIKHKTEELDDKISEVRRRFKVSVSAFLLVVSKKKKKKKE